LGKRSKRPISSAHLVFTLVRSTLDTLFPFFPNAILTLIGKPVFYASLTGACFIASFTRSGAVCASHFYLLALGLLAVALTLVE
jgi:hypothetical protein